MRTLKIIHNVIVTILLGVAMYIGSGIEATEKDILISYGIFLFIIVTLAARFIYEEKTEKK